MYLLLFGYLIGFCSLTTKVIKKVRLETMDYNGWLSIFNNKLNSVLVNYKNFNQFPKYKKKQLKEKNH